LALGTKLTVEVPVAVITIGFVIYCFRRRERANAAVWIVTLVASGCFWFVRNWILQGSPIPYTRIGIGRFSLPANVPQQKGRSVLAYIGDGRVWRQHYLPGLEQAFTRAWPVVLLVAVVVGVVAIVQRGAPLRRILGAAVLLGLLGYAATPLTADGRG